MRRAATGYRSSLRGGTLWGMRVMVADDAVLFREGLSRVLAEAGFEVTAKVADGQALLRPGARGSARRVRRRHPDAPDAHHRGAGYGQGTPREPSGGGGSRLVGARRSRSIALALIEDGAQGVGYLLKERVADLAEFTDAVRRVAVGGLVIDPSVVAQLVGAQTSAQSTRRVDRPRT